GPDGAGCARCHAAQAAARAHGDGGAGSPTMTRMTLAEAEKAMRAPRTDPAAATKNKAAPVAAANPVRSGGSGEVRIIGGQWKRTRLPVAQRPGLRPTPDRVRETLFNWLGQDLTGWRCF